MQNFVVAAGVKRSGQLQVLKGFVENDVKSMGIQGLLLVIGVKVLVKMMTSL